MSSEDSNLLFCYNKGCGLKFDPKENKEDSCTFHPGNPVFHNAYKGWSCCNKKSTDFTEFLNIKGCVKSYHSNVKPPESEKPSDDKSTDQVIEYCPPIPKVSLIVRPSFDSPLIKMEPEISPLLKNQIEDLVIRKKEVENSGGIALGTTCRNGGCKFSYEGPKSEESTCVHHPGIPVFHEGLKYWSCCQKKTTDFSAFVEQIGCEKGTHVWVKEKNKNPQVVCRYDWHQTGSHVVISVFAKKYDPVSSTVELNPVRAKIHLVFPNEESFFEQDMELFGIVEVDKSSVKMLQTKVEISLKKAEPGSWVKLEQMKISNNAPEEADTKFSSKPLVEEEAVDLSDIS